MKKYSVAGLVFVIISSFIGAGFASGKEVANYFARHKLAGLFFAVVLGVVFYYLILRSLTIGKKLNDNNNKNTYTYIFGKAGIFIKAIVVVACFIIIGAMIAGNASLLSSYFNKQTVLIINACMLLFAGIIVLKGYKLVVKLNFVLLPLILFTIVVICVFFLKENRINYFIALQQETTYLQALLNSVEYMSFNLLVSGVFLIEIGRHYSYKQIKKASKISAIMLSILILFITISLVFSEEIINTELPIINMAKAINGNLATAVSMVMFFALITSLISNAYTLNNYLFKIFKTKTLTILFIFAIGFFISSFGFSFVVINFYSVIGLFGLFFCISLAIKKV